MQTDAGYMSKTVIFYSDFSQLIGRKKVTKSLDFQWMVFPSEGFCGLKMVKQANFY